MSTLQFTDRARADLNDIWDHIAQDNPSAARKYIATLLDKMLLLLQSPQLGRQRDDLRPGMRTMPVGNHVIFYKQVDKGIKIIRVLSGYRDITSMF